MFGLLISGRLVDTGFRSVDPTHALIDIPQVKSVNHVVVFLTGSQPFPHGLGGAVYFNWPDVLYGESWQLLGSLTNEKPSAIFKISKLKRDEGNKGLNEDMAQRFGRLCNHVPGPVIDSSDNAQLGISVESLVNIQGQTPVKEAEASSVPTFVEFSQKMVDNLFNYTSSFALSPSDIVNRRKANETYVPFSSIQNWYSNFERRLSQNPYFWKN
ncbi:HIKESHI [Lepeophtheirus salmonis]|uniref:HIKESHI n=1 Tax=Lepeophtheirus salmonis TaxID=72036 RepID=C1BU03_LEPSM|nr:protein OPI10 homolog [Lepeophtheirus salmonis]ACO12506.1 OPI10 homolog [Lepeophtheirus salmonis]ADD24420.1 Protein OPI10 homolog [Lepeophtheirus salmonis]ADD38929.1 Protein OPI10 homolog [Lepeophtheirus salmonis]CAB4055070.1 HIKESHI [Lepeophtheirus salmonis]CAF2768262.1 HIKESHI [Lepeophtheirus salmonis]